MLKQSFYIILNDDLKPVKWDPQIYKKPPCIDISKYMASEEQGNKEKLFLLLLESRPNVWLIRV